MRYIEPSGAFVDEFNSYSPMALFIKEQRHLSMRQFYPLEGAATTTSGKYFRPTSFPCLFLWGADIYSAVPNQKNILNGKGAYPKRKKREESISKCLLKFLNKVAKGDFMLNLI